MSKVAPNRVQKFKHADIARSQINEAKYNPRTIDEVTAAKLNSVLSDDDIGLVEPLVLNQRTGNLVGGHQRLKQMDTIHSDLPDYLVPVAVIDVDEAVERRINLVLNNHSLQGTWDAQKLEEMFKDTNPFLAGFDTMDLSNMYDGAQVLAWIDQYVPDAGVDDAEMPGTPDAENVADTMDEIEKIKAARDEHKAADRESLRSDHILVIVFDSADQCTKAMNALHLNPAEYFVYSPKALAAMKQYAADAYDVVTKPHA